MDDVGKLVLFRDIVTHGSFTGAAAARGLTHSTVSKHLKSLEAELGVTLLRRSSRRMSLTDTGQMVLQYSAQIGDRVDELRRRLEQLRGEVRGELKVSALVHVGRHLVRPALRTFLAQYPDVRITLELDDGPLALQRDGFDLAVRVGLPAEGALTARKLADNPVCIAASPTLLERISPPSHPSELAHLPTVAYRVPGLEITTWSYIDMGEIRTVTVSPTLRVGDGNTLLDAVSDGLGIGYLSAFAARDAIDDGRLVPLLTDFELPAYAPVFILHPSVDFLAPRVEAFKQHLLAAYVGG